MSTELVSEKRRGSLFAQRKRKNDFAEMCMEELKDILAFWKQTYQDPTLSLTERMDAAEKIVRRAVGDVPKAIEEGEVNGTINNGPTLYQFQWLPPDPADRSKVIEPE